ncbi:MAG TPA: YggS family pyridoxal phosphate-dependent enzyme [Jiangellaceae bacterium]|nr:YggS family pyridoxal phosphate-dependent enzyme [Jiangellaceae bacterium]
MTRRDQIAAGLAAVTARIERACRRVGRDPAEVTVVVVTKTFPAADVRLLADLGVRDVGESRDQEAAPKAAACADLGVTWHFVGKLQTNKAVSVARYADVVHSVDRIRLVDALDRAAWAAGRELRCLVQVSLADGPRDSAERGGAAPADVPALADRIAAAHSLRLAGVMAVAPLRGDPDDAFSRLTRVAETVQTRHSAATWVSAGMSGDLEAAVAHGATHLRVGTAILGARPPAG